MRIGQAFPSNYLKASDLEEDGLVVTISGVKMEDIGDDNKPVAYFTGMDKGLVLNKTNAEAITQVVGTDETDDWTGRRIKLYPTTTSFQGKPVECIRVHLRAPQPVQQKQQGAAAGGTGQPQRRSVSPPSGEYDDQPPITEDDIPW